MKNKKEKDLSSTQKISNFTDIPFDMIGCLPYIKMCSNRELIIEDAGKVFHYDCEHIKVRQGKITIEIFGRNLKILCLAGKNIRVTGFITELRFE